MSRTLETIYLIRTPAGAEWCEKLRFRLDVPDQQGRTKSFGYRWRTKPGWVYHNWKREGTDALLYRTPEVVHAVRSATTVWWAEGEKDADALANAGVVATSHHGGAGKITSDQVAWFKGHTGTIVLAYDLDPDDARGGNPGAMDVIKRYRMLRDIGIRRDQIAVVHAREGKDAADHLSAGYRPERMVSVQDLSALIRAAGQTRPSTVRAAGYQARPSSGGRRD